MEHDEYENTESPVNGTADAPPPREPGPVQPDRFEFDDWALI